MLIGITLASSAGMMRTVFLHPGRVLVTRQPCQVTTILGSCVAVCLWDAELKVGGINHFVLPRADWEDGPGRLRFGNLAIETLLAGLAELGAGGRNLVAKVFGGASMLQSLQKRGVGVGTHNLQLAYEALAEVGVPVVAEDVGGNCGRKIVFDTSTGSVLVKRL